MRVVGTSGLTGSNRQDYPGIIPNPAAIIPSPVGVRHVSDQSASSTVLLQQQQQKTTEKLLTTPGSPMESIRRRFPTGAPTVSQDWPDQHTNRQRHSIADQPSQSQRPTSPLVAVPILETQIGIKRTSLRARSPSNPLRATGSGGAPNTPLIEDPYADPG